MRNCLLMALAVGLVLGAKAWTDNPNSAPADPKRIEQLVEKLGSSNFTDRERARKELEAIGAAAETALRKAAQSQDLETSRRATEILRKLDEKKTTASVLTPKKVRLNIKDRSVLEAIGELEKVSGYKIEVTGDRTPLSLRKVTLDTGETTFWEAFDKLCSEGGLVENIAAATNPGFLNPVIPQPLPIKIKPIRIQPLPKQVNPRALPLPVLPVVPPAQAPKAPALQPALQAVVAEAVVAEVVAEAQPAAPQAQPGAAAQGQAGAQGAPGKAGAPGAPGQAAPGAPGKAAPVQVQVQPAIQIQPGRIRFPGVPTVNNGQIVVTDGKAQTAATSYSGAVRIRVVPPSQVQQGAFAPVRAGEALIVLDVAAEPRLQGVRVVGTPRIDKALDDQGQNLTAAMDPQVNANNGNVVVNGIALIARNPYVLNQRRAPVRLKLGDKQATSVKELTGAVSVEVLMPVEALLTVDKVLKAAGQTTKAKNGAALELNAIEKLGNGNYQLKIKMEAPVDPNNPFGIMGGFGGGGIQIMPAGGNVQVQQIQIQIGGNNVVIAGAGNVNSGSLPVLVDAQGKEFKLVGVPSSTMNSNGAVMTQNLTLVFQAQDGQGEPARLVLNGQRRETVQVPFSLRDVPLR